MSHQQLITTRPQRRAGQVEADPAHEDPSSRGGRHGMQTRYQGKRLCKWCRKLDLDSIFQEKHLTRVGGIVRRKGPTGGPSLKSCHLCKLFTKTYGKAKRYNASRYKLRALSSSRILRRGWQSIDSVMLSLTEDPKYPFLVPQAKGTNTVRILQPLVSIDLLKTWIDYCHKKHTKVCGVVETPNPVSSISSFRVIDCQTGKVVPWPGQLYATLSYVWGDGSEAPPFSETLPSEIPRTIEDAIAVTLALGLRFIWIDRYCINQQVKEEVTDTVYQMDLIYKYSEVTIIGAAGDGADHGLPGVKQHRRLPQPHARVGKHLLVSSMEDPVEVIKKSKWYARGWTYQEGVLARRRLIFTTQQVYFECGGMYCCEALNFDLAALHTNDGQRFRYQFRDKANLGMFPARLGHTAWEVVERITEYSQRKLGNPSDVLDGLKGILRAFEASRLRMHHMFGIPVLPRPPKPKELGMGSREEAQEIYDSFEWSPSTGFCAGLSWQVSMPLERRIGFPTWSWIGWSNPANTESRSARTEWSGPVEWAMEEYKWRTYQGDMNLRVRMQLRDGRILALDEIQKDYENLRVQVSGVLHIAAWVTAIRTCQCNKRARRGRTEKEVTCGTDLEGANGELLHWDFRPTATNFKVEPSTPCLGIHLAKDLGFDRYVYVLVVAEVEPGVYERVGFGEWSQINPGYNPPDPCVWRTDKPPPPVTKWWQELRLR